MNKQQYDNLVEGAAKATLFQMQGGVFFDPIDQNKISFTVSSSTYTALMNYCKKNKCDLQTDIDAKVEELRANQNKNGDK